MQIESDPIDVYRGNDLPLDISVYNGTMAMNISGYELLFTVKKNIDDDDNNILISKNVTSHIDPVRGKSLVYLTQSDTMMDPGDYVYELTLVEPILDVVTTIDVGIFKIVKRVIKGML